jgi:hypothetical protein
MLPRCDVFADRIGNRNMAPRGDTSKHPFHDCLRQQIIIGECVPRRGTYLGVIGHGAASRPVNGDL